jgi:hypothetical protein
MRSRPWRNNSPETTGIEVMRYQEFPDQSPWALIRHGANEGWVNSRYLRR